MNKRLHRQRNLKTLERHLSRAKKSAASVSSDQSTCTDFSAANGLTDGDMAHLLGIAPSHYSEFLHKKRELPKSALIRAYHMGINLIHIR